MTKLHELLAVEKPLEQQANACRSELISTFEKKRNHFQKATKTYTSNTAGEAGTVEEISDIQTSVASELAWIQSKMIPALDAAYAIDVANTTAKADIVLDNGDTVAFGVPATALLQLEKRATEIVDFIKKIPTLDPTKGFTWDEQTGTYAARPVTKNKTKKQETNVIVIQPTDKHPGQWTTKTEDIVTGVYTELEWSSLITTVDKGKLLDKAEELARAIKRARSRANDSDVDVTTAKIGLKLLGYVFGDKNNKVGAGS